MQSWLRGPEVHQHQEPETLSPHLESLTSPLAIEQSASEQWPMPSAHSGLNTHRNTYSKGSLKREEW